MSHSVLVLDARKAISRVFTDRTVDVQTAMQSLKEISEEIGIMIESLREHEAATAGSEVIAHEK